jgi:hypothetical protein
MRTALIVILSLLTLLTTFVVGGISGYMVGAEDTNKILTSASVEMVDRGMITINRVPTDEEMEEILKTATARLLEQLLTNREHTS